MGKCQGLLGAGTGLDSCAAPPFRATRVEWSLGCPAHRPCCSEFGYCRTREGENKLVSSDKFCWPLVLLFRLGIWIFPRLQRKKQRKSIVCWCHITRRRCRDVHWNTSRSYRTKTKSQVRNKYSCTVSIQKVYVNKTQYFRLRLYNFDFDALNSLWMLSDRSLISDLSVCFLNLFYITCTYIDKMLNSVLL